MLNKSKAFTMIEMIISMSIMAFFVIAIAFSVNKKQQQRIGVSTGGYFACYKDANNSLYQKTEIRYADTTFKNEGSSGSSCSFDLPEGINNFKIELIGGGGGAGADAAPVVNYRNENGSIASPFVCSDMDLGGREYCVKGDSCSKTLVVSPIVNEVNNFLENYMSDSAYAALFLRNLSTVVEGGSDMDGISGARCATVNSFKVGDKVICVNGVSETGTDIDAGLVDGNWTSSSKGFLRVNNSDKIVAQGKVVYDGYVLGSSDFSDNPSCLSGLNTDSDLGVQFEQKDYSVDYVASINLTRGLAGEAGGYMVRANQKATDISNNGKVVIAAEDIGNGGQAGRNGLAGSAGGVTRFTLPTLGLITAGGGAGGTREENACDIIKNRIENSQLETYEMYSECYKEGAVANVSRYVETVLFPAMAVVGQQKMKSKAGSCNESGCVDAAVAENVSYGNGGSSGAVRVFYDYIKQFQLTDSMGRNIGSTPINEYEVQSSAGANGSGGAIVISW